MNTVRDWEWNECIFLTAHERNEHAVESYKYKHVFKRNYFPSATKCICFFLRTEVRTACWIAWTMGDLCFSNASAADSSVRNTWNTWKRCRIICVILIINYISETKKKSLKWDSAFERSPNTKFCIGKVIERRANVNIIYLLFTKFRHFMRMRSLRIMMYVK